MQGVKRMGMKDSTLLEPVLRLHGQFRRSLVPIGVTPLQAGVLLFLRRHPEAKVSDAADVLVVRVPTVSDVLIDLVRKRWVNKTALSDGCPCRTFAAQSAGAGARPQN